MAAICVFCGSRNGTSSVFAEAAAFTGRVLAERGDTLIYGGGSTGLMGVVADEMLSRHASVTGVIPEALATVELMHTGVTDMRVVPDMHVRKATMHELADGYIALPGGFGTLEELFEALCWSQLDFHDCPVAVLNPHGYYDGLFRLLQNMVQNEFLDASCLSLLRELRSEQDVADWLAEEFPLTP